MPVGVHTPSGSLIVMTDRPVRLRFAPSPTGFFHVGGARTALYNRIVATQHGGTLILRIEDTDAERNRPEWTQGIMDALRWIGADWDEGPYFQSERGALHRQAAERLYADGFAYYCDCTREQIEARTKGNATPGYDGYCRDRRLGPGPGRALRFRTPREGTTTVVDLIRGTPTFENARIEDFVIQRSDGSATFILANVVDDMDMKVSHVIRGEEHLSNTPKALLLWDALGGGEPPVWAHVPVLVNEKRQKLSKRRDKVALEAYRDEGYVADAMRNYLMTLGWAPPGDREIVPWEVIVDTFRLEDVNSAPAFFDERKLLAFNDEYVRAMPVDDFVAACEPWISPPRVPWPPESFDPEVFRAAAPLAQERCKVLSAVTAYVDFLFLDVTPDDPASWAKAMTGDAAGILDDAIAAYETAEWQAPVLKAALEAIGGSRGLKLAKAQAPVRVATMGRSVGLPLFESLVLLGRERTLERLRTARGRL
jgi:glutamyl-tRNA synthetase